MSKTCHSCGLCMTCSASGEHECPYPDCDKWHLCPKRTQESNASARSRARASIAEGRDDLEF